MANNIKSVQVEKNGDWALPVITETGETLFCVQINKTQAEKDDWANIEKEYSNANIQTYHYFGKNNGIVHLVEMGNKLKAQRANVNRDAIIETLIASGMTQEMANATYAKMQETVKAKKSNK